MPSADTATPPTHVRAGAEQARADAEPDRAGTGGPILGTVLVTGAASGLGAAVADAVAAAGGTPVALDLAEPADGVDHELVDLADTAATEAAVARVVERHGGLDAVVTAAGIDACGRLDEVAARPPGSASWQ